jgi:hypothetical protein
MHGEKWRRRRVAGWVGGCLVALLGMVLTAPVCLSGQASEAENSAYVGSSTCQPCHSQEFNNFVKYARKNHSYRSVQRMQKGLSPEEVKGCYACHTTGYGKPGGFVSVEQTPELKDAGCEVCHGPGKNHAGSQDPTLINRNVTLDTCQRCHTQERVGAFRYRPLLHGGAH